MNTNKLKAFARAARTKLMNDVEAKLEWVLSNKNDNAELLGNRKSDVAKLEAHIDTVGKDRVVEEVAYTWFNRLMALRFMDANGYNASMVLTPELGATQPQILMQAKMGHIDDSYSQCSESVFSLLQGRTISPNGNAESDAYRLLLIAACNSWNKAMPFMFEQLNSYIDLLLSDYLLADGSIVQMIREGMSDADCQQEEVIGWLYQFYIAELKEQVELKKATKDGLKSSEIPAATQLFTPHWIVRYMVENTLGRIWMTLNPHSELRALMIYYIDVPEGQTSPIPTDVKSVKDIRFIDPCMGSGHVLVYAFELLCIMYELEGYSKSEIPALIFEHNIFGTDIDPRCAQLANFALTMKARAYSRRFLRNEYKGIHTLAFKNIDAGTIDDCGSFDKDASIYLLEQVENLGSLISVSRSDYDKIELQQGGLFAGDGERLKATAHLLSQKYHCVVTNPPYLGKGMNPELKKFVASRYPNSKSDLMATFMERCLDMNVEYGRTAMINQHSWMFLSSYEGLRKSIVEQSHIESLLHLGPRTFPEIGGEVVQNAAFVLGNFISDDKGQYVRLVDFADAELKDDKTLEAIYNRDCGWFYVADQRNFEKIPGSPIGYWVSEKMIEIFEKSDTLAEHGDARQGLATADNNRFLRLWSEVPFSNVGLNMSNAEEALESACRWFPYNKGGEKRRWYGNQEYLVNWENDGVEIKNFFDSNGKQRSVIRNPQYYFKPSISWSDITSGLSSYRYYPKGFIYDVTGMSCFDISYMYNTLGVINTKYYCILTKLINPTIHFQIGDFKKLPYCKVDLDDFDTKVESNIEISKQDWDAHETSWEFKRNELLVARDEIELAQNEASAEELAYSSPESLAAVMQQYCDNWRGRFMQLHSNEEELNRQFIEIYGLEEELTPDVPFEEITILQQGEIKIEEGELVFQPAVILKQFMSYAVGCMMGRYSLDKEGLILANQGEGLAEYEKLVRAEKSEEWSETFKPDEDGIIPVLEGEYFMDDIVERFKDFVKAAFGAKNYAENLSFITANVGDIRKYFYKDFYTDHVKMYKKRPIYWMFASPKKNFQVLVYMHRMKEDTPSKVYGDYLKPYIHKLYAERDMLEGELIRVDITAKEKSAATKRIKELSKILLDCEDYAKTLLDFATGCPTIDLDDGVKVNYGKFKGIVTKIVGLD